MRLANAFLRRLILCDFSQDQKAELDEHQRQLITADAMRSEETAAGGAAALLEEEQMVELLAAQQAVSGNPLTSITRYCWLTNDFTTVVRIAQVAAAKAQDEDLRLEGTIGSVFI